MNKCIQTVQLYYLSKSIQSLERSYWLLLCPIRPTSRTQHTPSSHLDLQTHRGTLRQLLRGRYLHVEVFGLRLPSRLDEPLQDLVWKGEEVL